MSTIDQALIVLAGDFGYAPIEVRAIADRWREAGYNDAEVLELTTASLSALLRGENT